MPAITVSLKRLNGFPQFHCFHCAAVIFNSEDGLAEEFCKHVIVFTDGFGDPVVGAAAPKDLTERLDEIDAHIVEELAALFDDDTVIFELIEPGRGGGHDGIVCLVAVAVDGAEEDDD